MKTKYLIPISLLCLSIATLGTAQSSGSNSFSALKWRSIGPFRGGRVAAVSGVIGQPGTFYIGLPLGGVWKTTSAGTTWKPIMDSVKEASSVGAVEVAPSDPNIIYVGMGDLVTGGGINEGNGVYKSIDAGKTWTHLGLDQTKQIPSILVDPHDPNIVMVAAQGNIHEKSGDRGIFRSTDGGQTWTKTLFIDDQTGIQKITWAYDNPNVMLATTDRHFYGAGPTARGRGNPTTTPTPNQRPISTGTSIYKSTDEGVTWTELKGGGLPEMNGRTSVAIAMGTNSQRMYFEGNFGLYRSDDGGTNWRRMDETDPRVKNGQGGYNCGIYVSPADPDLLYLVNTCMYISKDGGNTFTGFKGAPGGDDPQQVWIDPTDKNRILMGSDQGATVTLDGGQNWSSWYNQATAQVYHIATDNRFPFWVYATQQDSGSIGTASRGNYGEITPLDWTPHPGYEFGSITVDPLNPNITYAGGENGGISKVTMPSDQWVNVSPNMDSSEALRKVGNQPIGFSPTNPHELFAGFQYLMATTDGGMHWRKLSPDLGFPKGYKPPVPEKPATAKPGTPTPKPPVRPKGPPVPGAGAVATGASNVSQSDQDWVNGASAQGFVEMDDDQQGQNQQEQFGGPGGGSIESFSSSSINGRVIWVGTNNGLIKLTQDGGKTWEDVSIPNEPSPTRADISSIDSSHQDLGTAYVAIDEHNLGDYKPYFYRTNDFGKTWTKIVAGLPDDQPSGSFARVIRADTEKAGLLFAGTESSMYVSFDDGNNWQSLMLNLPNTSYRDAVINGNDLVVGTYGRSFWVLDDFSPLRQMDNPSINSSPAFLFKPGDAVRVRRNVNDDTPFPPEVPHALNPPEGAIIYYNLASVPTGEVTLNILDSKGNIVRHMSSVAGPDNDDKYPPIPNFWIAQPHPLPTTAGMSRVNWDLRYDDPPSESHEYKINANPGLTPASPQGPLAMPGKYVVALTVNGHTYNQNLTVVNDPRSPANGRDIAAQHDMQMKLYQGSLQAYAGSQQVKALREAIKSTLGTAPSADVTAAADDLNKKLDLIGGSEGNSRFRFFFRRSGPPPAPTFSEVWSGFNSQIDSADTGDMAPGQPAQKACEIELTNLKKVWADWKTFNDVDLPKFNELLKQKNLNPIASNFQSPLKQN